MRNLTELSLRHRSVVWYFIIVFAVGGILAYESLGRMEDPSFIIRQMVITAAWPGATAEDMQEQVTDKLERRFQDTPGLKEITSETRAGQTIIYVDLRDDVDENLIRPTWRDVRNFGEDAKRELPDGVIGPFYNDRFDDVYGSIYAVTGEDYTDEELRRRRRERAPPHHLRPERTESRAGRRPARTHLRRDRTRPPRLPRHPAHGDHGDPAYTGHRPPGRLD